MLEGQRRWQESGNRQLGQMSLLLAEAYKKAGRVEEGLALLTEAEGELDKSNEKWWESELLRVRGKLLLTSKDNGGQNSQEAEACF